MLVENADKNTKMELRRHIAACIRVARAFKADRKKHMRAAYDRLTQTPPCKGGRLVKIEKKL